jgi:hypothetical protein
VIGDTDPVETVIIGGGHTGLTMSYSLNQLKTAEITSIVWTTGFRYDFDWVNCRFSMMLASQFTDVGSQLSLESIFLG